MSIFLAFGWFPACCSLAPYTSSGTPSRCRSTDEPGDVARRRGQKRALCPDLEQTRHRGGSRQNEMRWSVAKQLKQRRTPALALSKQSMCLSSPLRPAGLGLVLKQSKIEGALEYLAPSHPQTEFTALLPFLQLFSCSHRCPLRCDESSGKRGRKVRGRNTASL